MLVEGEVTMEGHHSEQNLDVVSMENFINSVLLRELFDVVVFLQRQGFNEEKCLFHVLMVGLVLPFDVNLDLFLRAYEALLRLDDVLVQRTCPNVERQVRLLGCVSNLETALQLCSVRVVIESYFIFRLKLNKLAANSQRALEEVVQLLVLT